MMDLTPQTIDTLLSKVKYTDDGLVAAIAQDVELSLIHI